MSVINKCFFVFVVCHIICHLTNADESFVIEDFRGYPMFREDEIRGRRTLGNIMNAMGTDDTKDSYAGLFDSYGDSSAQKKSKTVFTNEQVDKVLEEAFREEPFDEDINGVVRNNVDESIFSKHAHDGSIPLSIIENEQNGNPYARDIVENELVDSPFSVMDTGMSIGRKFRHKVV
ncbi:uncharacterized protein LOC124434711 [Xenia sp. Carnegie-2017]|uniref:uncharacterized protein LOC124434711 n=1 Tax=Xenia sp. Carnegie-2017 TaxID=2897299 RepID=UPI001F03EE63|nr:uncharacterized protein LOC124434711 [Xenia sp. Carnegie-2017]XP_046840571.1 uncharacterized protein LOC124434711 [Xenia sp. Carnegie-2017]